MSARHSNKNNRHSNINMEKQPDKKEIDNKNVFTSKKRCRQDIVIKIIVIVIITRRSVSVNWVARL